jgi:hypothetical protein
MPSSPPHRDFLKTDGPGHSACNTAVQAVFALFGVALLMAASPMLVAQALPAAEAAPISTGFALPTLAGSLQYAVSASESLTWGYYGNAGAAASTNLTGDLAYISNSRQDPFSMILSGGHSWANQNQPSYSYANLGLSQVIAAGRWNFVLGDSIGYLPGTAISGLSGVAGVGDLGLNPGQVGGDTGQGVLTNYSTRVTNTAAGSVSRQLTGKTALNAAGSYAIMRFVGDSSQQGLDSDSTTGSGGVTHRYDARNMLGGNYSYSSVTFSGGTSGVAESGFVSQTPTLIYTHQFTRKFGMSASAGPEWTSVNIAGSGTSLSLFADASLSYAGQFSHATVSYIRSTNQGFGVIGGTLSDSVSGGAGRVFARVWNCSAIAGYTRATNLPSAGVASIVFNTVSAGGQASRAIARNLSGYASYTLEHQTVSGSATTVDVFSGVSQTFGFGLTYSPAALHLGRQ